METYFASPARADEDILKQEVFHITHNPVIDHLLSTVGGLIAVLNRNRQILAVNETFLKQMQIADPETVLGLRPGEFVHCVHAEDMPGGCGTSEYCATCGAAISIVSSLESDLPVERKCSLTIDKNGEESDLFLNVRACPIRLDGKKYILLFLNDISNEQQSANITRMFFHDINNIVFAIQGRAEMLHMENEADTLSRDIFTLAQRLSREIDIQRCFTKNGQNKFTPVYQGVSVDQLLLEITDIFANHPWARNKTFRQHAAETGLTLTTDYSLVTRILINLITNAFEATEENGMVMLTASRKPDGITFTVWNQTFIPDAIAKRVFQKNFSTKSGAGRGLGTYATKFFGEEVLGGRVTFTSTPEDGTTFVLTLPVSP